MEVIDQVPVIIMLWRVLKKQQIDPEAHLKVVLILGLVS